MTRSLAHVSLALAVIMSAYGAANAPAAFARVADEKVERVGADKVAVTWSAKAPVDVYLADSRDSGLAKAKLVAHDNTSGRFEVAVDALARPYVYLKDSKDGAVTEIAERVLPLEQGSNFRDVGGYPAAGGKHVRWGMVYRSGGTPLLSDPDLARIKLLKLTDMVDLRSSEERVVAPSKIEDVRYEAVGYTMAKMNLGPIDHLHLGATYRTMPHILAPQLRLLFKTLLADDTTVVYNCSAGQDRTGFATALLLSALGVPRDTIVADYHLSTIYRRPQWEMPKLDPANVPPAMKYLANYAQSPSGAKPQPLYDEAHKSFLDTAFAELDATYGGVEGYLDKELGVSAADITKLRAKYLE